MRPFWATFYSYKGGVGRSLALANVAALLVKRGRRVVLIDFDLEAPGLDSFAEFADAAGRDGVIEYVSEFKRLGHAPEIREFVHHCKLPGHLRGNLWLMPAGRKDSAYNRHLAHINWAELYESGMGSAFFANWKAAINEEYYPDVVLIDSRTGLTEIGGVCTTQFPDLVVMLFGLNEQNIRGTATVARSIREADPERVPQIHFVASPVPNLPAVDRTDLTDKRPRQNSSQLVDRLEIASQHLGVEIKSRIRYYPPAALFEKLFVLGMTIIPQTIVGDYDNLCEQIIQFNRTGLDFLIEQVDTAIEAGDTPLIERIITVLNRDFLTRAEAVFQNSRIAIAKNDIDAAVHFAKEAFSLDPLYSPPFTYLLNHYIRSDQFLEAEGLFAQLLLFKEQLSEERLSDIQFNQGSVLMALGKYAEAELCYRDCMLYVEKLEASMTIRLVSKFNAAEAHRRAALVINANEWRSVIEMFKLAFGTSDSALPQQANRLQAMHIAHAVVGDISDAKEALLKARRAAEAVGEIEDIFSVKRYRDVSVAEFIADNDEMLTALGRGQLWDGMRLPVA